MRAIHELLSRFTLWVSPQTVVADAFIKATESHGIQGVNARNISFAHGTIFLSESASIKAAIRLQADTILKAVNAHTTPYKLTVNAIR